MKLSAKLHNKGVNSWPVDDELLHMADEAEALERQAYNAGQEMKVQADDYIAIRKNAVKQAKREAYAHMLNYINEEGTGDIRRMVRNEIHALEDDHG